MPSKAVRQLIAAVGVFVVVAAGIAALLVYGGEDEPATPPGTAVPVPPQADHVLVVKIDNVAAAKPQTGLSAADVVYVEPVEGGLTRLAALYSARLPDVVGPVRSARETDIQLLAQYGHPVLAYSGGAPEIQPLLRRAPMMLVTDRDAPRAFYRDPDRRIPHNLYVRPGRLPRGGGGPGPRHVFQFGAAPAGGTATTRHDVGYRAASYRFSWSPEAGRWVVSMNDEPLITTESGRVGAATVVVQRIRVREGMQVRDAAGQVSPVAITVGDGPATVLRDGMAYEGRWSRPAAGEGTRFVTGSGRPLPLAPGPVWVLLVPR